MYPVSTYRRVRIDYERNGLSQRELSWKYGLHRYTIRKMLEFSIPPGYQRKNPPNKPKLAPFIGVIDVILESDKDKPRKQRHTAKRIFERIQEEHISCKGGSLLSLSICVYLWFIQSVRFLSDFSVEVQNQPAFTAFLDESHRHITKQDCRLFFLHGFKNCS